MDVFLFIYGLNLVNASNKSQQPSFYANCASTDSVLNLLVIINDLPTEKEKFIKCGIDILEIKTIKGYKPVSGSSIAYFKKPITGNILKPGEVFLIKAKLSELSPPLNPFEFDYKSYLNHKQIYHTIFVDSASFVKLHVGSKLNPIWQLGLYCKSYILTQLKSSSLSKSAYAICSALLTGYDDNIDKSVIEAFAHTGTLHVLSVSGLHTGLIYLVLSFMIDLIDRKRKFKFFKFISITVTLWLFALVSGFSAPVLRAVIMFNLLGLGKIYFRNESKNQINILAASAFILLSYNPFFIKDIGFLLSYFAMLGLMYFQPIIAKCLQPSNSFIKWTWQSISASLAATITTLPLTLFYFKQFPLWFFICNLLVVPATFAILLLSFLVVIKLNGVSIIINFLIKVLIEFIQAFNSKRYGFIDGIDFTFIDLFYLLALIILISATLQFKSYKAIIFSFIVLICWQITSLVFSYYDNNNNLFAVYHIKGKTSMLVKNKTISYLTPTETSDYNYHIKSHIISFNYSALKQLDFNYVKFNNLTLLHLNKPGYWPSSDIKEVNTIVISNNYDLRVSHISNFRSLNVLIVDGSNNSRTLNKIAELGRKFGIAVYNTKLSGAYLLSL